MRQPWCNGTIAALGEIRTTARRPVRSTSIAPCFSLFDVYTDIAFPGSFYALRPTDLGTLQRAARPQRPARSGRVMGSSGAAPACSRCRRDRLARDGAIAAHRGN